MIEQQANQCRLDENTVRELLAEIANAFSSKPFVPHPIFTNKHAQTLSAYAWPGRRRTVADDRRLFQIEPGIRLSAECRWQCNPREHSTLVIWHGMEGSTSSVYMLGTARKAFATGFNVLRVNLRNCGGTEDLTPTLYHGGLSQDLRAVLNELIEQDGLPRLFVAGFSLGGNLVLKLAGEYEDQSPAALKGICAISPAVDLARSVAEIMKSSNWIYHQNFVRNMKRRVRIKKKFYPELYDLDRLQCVRTLRDFDELFTSAIHGFANADDYYRRASALPLISKIRLPTLIIHAEDDPFIPFAPLRTPDVSSNPYVLFVAPTHGGHVAFVGAHNTAEDRFWAENRVVEFCKLVEQHGC